MDIIIAGVSGLAIITILNQIIKQFVGSRFIPPISVGLGLIVAYAAGNFILSVEMVVGGILLGLASCGAWDLGKKSLLNR